MESGADGGILEVEKVYSKELPLSLHLVTSSRSINFGLINMVQELPILLLVKRSCLWSHPKRIRNTLQFMAKPMDVYDGDCFGG